MDKVSLAALTLLRLSVTEIVISGCDDAVKPLVDGDMSCNTGAIVSTVANVEVNAAVCTLPLASVSPFTVTTKVLLAGSGAAGVNTAWVGLTSTVLPPITPAGPVTAMRLARFVLADNGSLKFTVMVLPLGT